MGTGAAAIAKLMNNPSLFPVGEGELERVLNELGPFPGLFFIFFRLGLAAMIAAMAVARARRHEPLALLLVPVTLSSLFLGVLEQPTEQGFMVISLAFSLAALNQVGMSAKEAPSVPSGDRQMRIRPRTQNRASRI
jgi:ABC-type Fe3+-siderophore transport system permease subunit